MKALRQKSRRETKTNSLIRMLFHCDIRFFTFYSLSYAGKIRILWANLRKRLDVIKQKITVISQNHKGKLDLQDDDLHIKF